MRKLSDLQWRALSVLLSGQVLTARQIGDFTGQSSDGAAYTLRSLVRRGLVLLDHHDGDHYGYKITEAGRHAFGPDQPVDNRMFCLAKYVPLYPVESQVAKRPSHIVLASMGRYGQFNHPGICGVQTLCRRVNGKLSDATCRKCVRKAIELGIITVPAELADPVHHGDIFSRIEASQS